MVVSNQIELDTTGTPEHIIGAVVRDLTLRNPKYDAAVKQGRNPYNTPEYIRLYRFEDETMVLPRGYGKTLQDMLIKSGIRPSVKDDRLTLPPVTFQSKIKLRDYQGRAVNALLSAKQGGVVAPCGAGKTMILLETMARIGQPTLWVTHTTELAEQVIKRATEILDITEDEIGRIYGGQMTVGERFTVALVQSLSKVDIGALRSKFGAILVDEAHHMAASTFFYPVGSFPAMYRVWASATPERSDGLTQMVFAGSGPIVNEIQQSEVPTILPRLKVIETEYTTSKEEYVSIIGDLIKNKDRNNLVINTIVKEAPGHYSLVISDRVEHLEILRDMITAALPDMRLEILTGSMKKTERSRVMQMVQNKEVNILLATQLAREGLDIKHLDRLFLVTPKRAAGAVQQECGRVMRPEEGKTEAVVFDFWDSKTPILKQQYWKRREVYRKIGMVQATAKRPAAK